MVLPPGRDFKLRNGTVTVATVASWHLQLQLTLKSAGMTEAMEKGENQTSKVTMDRYTDFQQTLKEFIVLTEDPSFKKHSDMDAEQLFLFGHPTRPVEPQFPDQGWNLCPLQ